MSQLRAADLESRIEEYEEAVGTFAHLHRELTDLRDRITVPEATNRVEAMLRLNAETLHAIKQRLATSLAAMKQHEQEPDLVMAGWDR